MNHTPINWNDIKIHCSTLYSIMVAGDGFKTNYELWQEACDERDKKEAAFEKLRNKNGKKGVQYLSRLDELDLLIPELEKKKDVVEAPPLSKGCKTFLTGLYANIKYGKWSPNKDIGSKQTQKGKDCEDEAIMTVNKLDGLLLYKNQEVIEDSHFIGHPDCFEGENLQSATVIHDVKCPWDIETFFANINSELNKQYWWQMQGYMAITGAKLAKVHFCMVNTPLHQIKRMRDHLLNSMNVATELNPEFLEAEKRLINNLTYDDMPLVERRLCFMVQRDDGQIELARKRVELCREYLREIENLHQNFINPENSRNFTYETPKEQK